ncbi:MAG: PAS domain S-box protein [Thermodesulfobacteriota bacterium]|nr:PAS domain S-box protein [Thermodesulfobacteriota bacterium]
MKDGDKTKEQLIEELVKLRQQITELEKSKTKKKYPQVSTQKTHELLKHSINSTSITFYIAKTSGYYGATFITPNVKQVWGYEPNEFIDNSSFWIDHVHPEDKQRILSKLLCVFKEKFLTYEYRFLHKKGIYRWVRDEMYLVEDGAGNPIEIAGYFIDITERKMTEEALQESEEKYRNLFHSLVTGTSLVSLSGEVQDINEAGAAILGFDRPEDIIGRNIVDFYKNPEDRDMIIKKIAQGDIHNFEIEMVKKDGSVINCWISTSMVIIKGVKFRLTSAYDITGWQQLQEKLQKRKEEYRSLVQSTDDSIYLIDRIGTYLFINKKYLARLGLPLDKVLGRNYGAFHSEDNTKAFLKNVEKAFKTGRSFQQEHRSERDGKYFLRTLSPVRGPEGSITSITVTSKDITHRKQAEEALTQASKKLHRAYNQRKMLSRMLINLLEKDRRQIAMELHDHIGQTLTSLKMSLEVIHEKLKPGNEESETQIKTAQAKVIQAIKDVKNISHGLRPTMIDTLGIDSSLREMFNQIQEHMDIDIHYFSRGIPKRFEDDKELAIYRIAQEALSNIISHARAKNIFVNLVRKVDKLSFSVEDNGIGFDQAKIMNPSNSKRPFGLLIMRERAQQHDGEFIIESHPGKGTHVLVEIPL